MYFQTQGIILRQKDFRENDSLFLVYTKSRGKIEVLVRGAKKIKSKLAPHLSFFSLIDLMVVEGRNFNQLVGARISNNFYNLKSNLFLIALASSSLEVVDLLIRPSQRDERILGLLLGLFGQLDQWSTMSDSESLALVRIFNFKLLVYLGYQPELYHCLVCKNKIGPSGNHFNAERGGLICVNCFGRASIGSSTSERISANAIKILRLMLESDLRRFFLIKMEPKLIDELNRVIKVFLAWHLGQELKSEPFFKLFFRTAVDRAQMV